MKRKAIFILGCLLFFIKVQAVEADLVISEIMYDASGADSGHEWIEVHNSGPDALTVSSTWRFFDGFNHNINLLSGTTTIASDGFFILADNADNFLLDYPEFLGVVLDTVMSLPNSSSSIALSLDEGTTYSAEVLYDSSWGGSNGFSLQKVNDVWQESCDLGGTPGQANSECVVEDDPPADDEVPADTEPELNEAWVNIIISEFLPNPIGSDDEEWVELFNNGDVPIALNGFALGDNSSRRFTIAEVDETTLNLGARTYLLLPKSQTGISLNNSGGDAVKLYNPEGVLQETIEYSGVAWEGRSFARSDSGFVWTKNPSPGSVNNIVENQPPIAQISVEGDFKISQKIDFSGETSSDPEGDDLDYYWEFGDGNTSSKIAIKHKFEQAGNFTVQLTVTDPEGASDQAEFIVNIYPEPIEISIDGESDEQETEEAVLEIAEIDFSEDDLIISEFIPNPKGSDDNEWIELYNNSKQDINLAGWYLDDAEGGSKPYQFSTSTIPAKGFLIVARADSKITLNNSTDAVRLIKPDGIIWQEVNYEKVPEAKTWAWDFENMEWSVFEPSPNAANIKIQESESIYLVSEIESLTKGDEILVQGLVINSPSKDTRSIYLADFDGANVNFDNLVEIYSYYKDFPNLRSGEVVTVAGEISKLDSLPRIKIKTAEQIWSNDQVIDFVKPEILSPDDLDQDSLEAYVTVKGVVVKKSGKSIYLASEAEEETGVRIYTKFSTTDLGIKKGSEVRATGILSETDSGYKLEPFTIEDIWVSQEVLGEKIEAEIKNGEIDISTSTNQVGANKRKANIKNSLLVIVLGVVVIGVVYFIKKKKSSTIDKL